jgi:hypothetical protein
MDTESRRVLELFQSEALIGADVFFERQVDILPPGWTICSIAVNPDQSHLLVTRLRACRPPIVLRIPFKPARPGMVGHWACRLLRLRHWNGSSTNQE